MRPKKPCPAKKIKFLLVHYINLKCSKTNGRNSRTHVVSCSLTGQGLTWLSAIGCETIRLKHATLLAKLPINADDRSWGVAWINARARHSGKGVQIQMRHFWDDYLHEVLPKQIEAYLVKARSTPSALPLECYATTQYFSQHGWHCG